MRSTAAFKCQCVAISTFSSYHYYYHYYYYYYYYELTVSRGAARAVHTVKIKTTC